MSYNREELAERIAKLKRDIDLYNVQYSELEEMIEEFEEELEELEITLEELD